ncbi:MAG TPA: hypothetical protein VNO26_05610, partial [Candidatus Limnocylindria bacterium]|nr:hypothetical protein [Candidatus Limnocylindria bacterium]
VFVRGLAAAARGSAEAETSLAKLREFRKESSSGDAYRSKPAEIRELEIAALAASSKKSHDEAISLMKRATALEEEMAPPSGPPSLIKPSHELFGEILLAAGRPKEAAAEFATALLRQPNRARSLLGSARAASASGDAKAAAEAYSRFLKQWQQADPNLPELREARDYLKQAASR